MTNILKNFLRDHADEMIHELRQLGFTRNQAQEFLAENITQVTSILRSRGHHVNLSPESESHLISLLTAQIQIPVVTSRLDIDEETAANGLQTILPIIVHGLIDAGTTSRTKKPSKAVIKQTGAGSKKLDSKH